MQMLNNTSMDQQLFNDFLVFFGKITDIFSVKCNVLQNQLSMTANSSDFESI